MSKDFVSREKLDEVGSHCGYGGYEEAHDAYEDSINKLLEAMNDT